MFWISGYSKHDLCRRERITSQMWRATRSFYKLKLNRRERASNRTRCALQCESMVSLSKEALKLLLASLGSVECGQHDQIRTSVRVVHC